MTAGTRSCWTSGTGPRTWSGTTTGWTPGTWRKRTGFSPGSWGGRGRNLWITPPFYVDYGCDIFFGDNCEVNLNCVFLDDNRITVGDNALIAPGVQIYTAFHPAHPRDRFGPPREDGSFSFCKTLTAPVTIGDNVWIGGGAVILPGVSIGDNVVIGAGSVVTKDIPSDTIACGNPCRVVRENRPGEADKEEELP